ncbi:MAG: biopolymer transporter ExbD [Planctomycetota bacterium]
MAASSAREEFMKEKMEVELTPMIDVAFLIIIFFMCLPFKTLDGKMAAFLPTEKGLAPTPEKPPEPFWIKIHVVGRKETERAWGPEGGQTTVKMPSEVKYRFGEEESESIDDVSAYIRRMKADWKKAPDLNLRGEIKAGHKVPHKYIIAVLNKFAEHAVEKIDFYGTQIPKDKLRNMKLLPYPLKNYVTSD